MARVNVEDELFKDQRFMNLLLEVGDFEKAIGAVVRCWLIGQRFWKTSSHGIPKTEWNKQRLNNSLISSGLAEDRGDFIFVVGSEKHFAWLRERSEAGRLGGLKSQSNFSSKAKQTQASPSLSLSSSLSPSTSHSKTEDSSERSDDRFRAADKLNSLDQVFIERKITTKVQLAWLVAFPDAPWIISEVNRALAWEAANPTRKKKNFAAFMTRWLTAGWDRRSVPASGKSHAPIDPKKIFGDDYAP